MKILVLTRNPVFTDLCQKAFADAAKNVADAQPLRCLEDAIADEMEAIMAASDNLTAATQIYPDNKIYVAIEGARIKDDPKESTAYALAIRYREKGLPTNIMTLRVTPEQNAHTEILSGLRTLVAAPYDVPSVEQLPFLPPYQ